MEVRYKDLTPEQRKLLCNGCGPKAWGGLKPPQFCFIASCDHHDFNYWLGNEEGHRLKADYQFYEAMKKDIANAPEWKRFFYNIWAWTYYRAVRLGGGLAFSYRPKQRDMADLLAAVEEIKSKD